MMADIPTIGISAIVLTPRARLQCQLSKRLPFGSDGRVIIHIHRMNAASTIRPPTSMSTMYGVVPYRFVFCWLIVMRNMNRPMSMGMSPANPIP